MGQKASTPANSGQQSPRLRTFSSSSTGATDTTTQTLAAPSPGLSFLRSLPGLHQQPLSQSSQSQQQQTQADRQRARSLSSVPDIQQQQQQSASTDTENSTPNATQPAASTNLNGAAAANYNNNNHNGSTQRRQISDTVRDTIPRTSILDSIALATSTAFSTTSNAASNGTSRVYNATSLPSHMWSLNGIKCPVCSKFVLPDDIEYHLVMCLTKPRLSYNEDVLTDAKGECVICLEDMNAGDIIARLPCLCIYHKSCIDRWFQINRSCPEHPSD